MEKKKVLVALSGGVDSSVCVHLLKQAGYEVGAVVLKMSPAHEGTVEDARRSAEEQGIPLVVKDMSEPFQKEVVSYFVSEYQRGRTPNPCIVCNPLVKFKALIDTADEEGYDFVATGHYAKLIRKDSLTYLAKGDSLARDQSYMLYRLGQRELSRLLFPLAELPKDEVRKIAAQIGLSCAQKPDSQEICFIPDNDYARYIEEKYGTSGPGDFISPEGVPCGRHKGIIHYTVGQRKRLGIALGRPVFVKEIDPVTNRVYLSDEKDAYENEILVSGISMTYPESIRDGIRAEVKIRSRATTVPCEVFIEGEKLKVVFDEPQKAPAKGQSAVLYDGAIVLGGGFIE
ncbi:tRNA 2-thiouridine(34) synthase MnmA [Fumia xinanensis]|uniref:tRNA-specific 2-thiouridylase MnmA n=1 Tax=Fumia xinanensis TaxID=2763659 RepID=A0A926I7J5_9FIRM|nr:tRNA 2-thiouridine(34) synthase MnmA [Fumia xinanensis]MBC8559922.1 tRNA 2-thiouridine(34) synthase MnmA [Fumia xinanensis]